MQAFLISLPIFLIIFSGWLLKKYKIVTDDWIHILNQFAYYVSLPALIITSLWSIDFSSRNSWNFIFLSLATVILFSLLVFIILSFSSLSHSKKTAIFLGATVGNTVYMGFPLIEFGFGKENLLSGALISIIYLIIPILISIFIIKYWQDRSHKILNQLKDFFKNPLIVSVFVGFVLSFLKIDFSLIDAIKKSFSLLGVTASPVALFALGGFLYGRFLKKNLNLAFTASILKTAIFPLFVILFMSYFVKTNSDSSGVFILLASMPVAITTFVIAEKFKIEEELIGNSILISIIISFFIIPLIIYLF